MDARTCLSNSVGILALAGATLLAAKPSTEPVQRNRVTTAVAVVQPTEGSQVKGTLKFVQTEDGVQVTGTITGLQPNSKHGFHIHEFGDMTKSDGTSMGGHYNPQDVAHGLPEQDVRHVGDMGNVTADASGTAKIGKTFSNLSIGGRGSILGRGVVVHEKEDDGGQPTGNAGGRIGYGVIGVANVSTG